MNQQAYLRSSDGQFTLSPKITIVGRESCDFTIKNLTVDVQHAAIEYLDYEQCFVLKDLNSAHGTFVNDCQVRNATVRLANGDIIRFGYSSGQYEFYVMPLVDTDTQDNITRDSWQTTAVLNSNLPNIQPQQPPPPMPPLQSRYTLPAWPPTSSRLGGQAPPPAPCNGSTGPTYKLTSRPQSASNTIYNNINKRQTQPSAPPAPTHNISQLRSSGTRGSISGTSRPTISDSRQLPPATIASLQQEVERLRPLERQLTERNRDLEDLQRQLTTNTVAKQPTNELTRQVERLSNQLTDKQREIEKLTSLLDRLAQSQQMYYSHNNQPNQTYTQVANNNANEQNDNNADEEEEEENNDESPPVATDNRTNGSESPQQLRKDLELTKKDLKISYGLVTSLQKDLCLRDDRIKNLGQEIEQLNNTISEKDITVSSLMNKLTKFKDVEDNENERRDRERELVGLRHKLSASEVKCEDLSDKNETLQRKVTELQHLETQHSEMIRSLTEQLEQNQLQLTNIQIAESLARVDSQDKEKKYERLRNRVMQVCIAVPGYKSSETCESLKDDQMIESIQQLLKEKIEHDRRMADQQKSYESLVKQRDEVLDLINQFSTQIKKHYEFLQGGERSSERIKAAITLFKTISIDNEALNPLRQILVDNLLSECDSQVQLETCIASAEPDLANLTLSECFKRVVDRCVDITENKKRMEEQLTSVQSNYDLEAMKLKEAYDSELESRIKDTVNEECKKLEENYQQTIEKLKQESEENFNELKNEFQSRIKELEDNIEILQNEVKNREETLSTNQQELQDKCTELATAEKQVVEMREQILELQSTNQQLEQSVCEQIKTAELQWQTQINLYKEESQQHAITIQSLNNKLTKMDKENKDLSNQIKKIKKQHQQQQQQQQQQQKNAKSEKKSDQSITESSEDSRKDQLKEDYFINNSAEMANLERVIAALRYENAGLKQKVQEDQDLIKSLHMDIAGAEARLSDVRGEMDEAQKTESDKMRIEINKLEDELTDTRIQLSKMSSLVDKINEDLEDRNAELRMVNNKLLNANQVIEEKDTKIIDLELEIDSDQQNWLAKINNIEKEGRLSTELAAIGSQCRGERHHQIIEAQRSALSELRQKVKHIELNPANLNINEEEEFGDLYSTDFKTVNNEEVGVDNDSLKAYNKVITEIKDGVPSNVFPKFMKSVNATDTQHQMIQMKKELAELRAKQALKEGLGNKSLNEIMTIRSQTGKVLAIDDKQSESKDKSNHELDKEKEKEALELKKSHQRLEFDMEMAKSTLEDVQKSLELSESSYLNLVRHLMKTLDIDNVKGSGTLSNIPGQSKQIMFNEREETIGRIVQKIRILQEKITRKEELLQGYEKDLVKLRQAEDLAMKTQLQLDSFVENMRDKSEEIELLRETLNRTKDLLNQEKRSNAAMKQHKHYIPEKSDIIPDSHRTAVEQFTAATPKFHCPPADLIDKDKIKDKIKADKLKRKNYEIKSLKSELSKKDREFNQVSNRLCNLETTMGIKSDQAP